MMEYKDKYYKFTNDDLDNVIWVFQIVKNLCYSKRFDYDKGERFPDMFFTLENLQDEIYECLATREDNARSLMA